MGRGGADSAKVAPDSTRASKFQGLDAAAAESARTAAGSPANTLGPVTVLEHITYGLENRITANPNYPFILLIVRHSCI